MTKDTVELDKKAIRFAIKNEILRNNPSFASLKRKQKQTVVKNASRTVMDGLANGEQTLSILCQEERVGLEKIPNNIMTISEMSQFIANQQQKILPLPNPRRDRYIRDDLLQTMDKILDDSVINTLLATPSLTPTKRKWMPAQLLRIEMLRTAKFPSLSVRQFCQEMSSTERKQERAFCNLPLHSKKMCPHTRLSAFRLSLSFEQRVNLMVFMLHHFLESGQLGESTMHMIDSTDVATAINSRPLHKVKMPDGKTINFYSDLDADCGPRRNKRDKSKMFVGYRVHTLCVTNVKTRMAFPIFSLAVAANHHDSQLLEPLLDIARAAGVEVKLLSADEAYADADRQSRLVQSSGLHVVTPPKSKVSVPQNVDAENQNVYCNAFCEIPMQWRGLDADSKNHIFSCCDDDKTCPMRMACKRQRLIPLDTGLFGPLPNFLAETRQSIALRKVTERPFNLLKHMDGMEPCRMKNQATVSAQLVFSQMVGTMKVMAGLRAQPKMPAKRKPQQEDLPLVVNA